MTDLAHALPWRGDPHEIIAELDRDAARRHILATLASGVPEWHHRAACAGTDIEIWFPSTGVTPRSALAICQRCTVRAECLDEAVDDPDLDYGVRGGMTANARRKLRRRRDR